MTTRLSACLTLTFATSICLAADNTVPLPPAPGVDITVPPPAEHLYVPEDSIATPPPPAEPMLSPEYPQSNVVPMDAPATTQPRKVTSKSVAPVVTGPIYDAYPTYQSEVIRTVPPQVGPVHVRHPWYNYRAPWFTPGPASLNVTIVW